MTDAEASQAAEQVAVRLLERLYEPGFPSSEWRVELRPRDNKEVAARYELDLWEAGMIRVSRFFGGDVAIFLKDQSGHRWADFRGGKHAAPGQLADAVAALPHLSRAGAIERIRAAVETL